MQLQSSTVDPLLSVCDIVRDDYRTADVFKHYGINYCCGGQASLIKACDEKNLKLAEVVSELTKATHNITLPNTIQFQDWKPDFLIDYIINIHHAYLKYTLPALETNLTSFISSHTAKYPELKKVLSVFRDLKADILEHNQHEEEIIFPYLKQIINTHRRKETYGSLFVKTLRKPLHQVVEKEHQLITNLLLELRQAADFYSIPAGACTNYQVLINKLKELDKDLLQHKYLENDVLFPKVMEMEKELLQL